jgi:hypothetical protein
MKHCDASQPGVVGDAGRLDQLFSVVGPPHLGLAGRQPHPHRQFQFALRGYGGIHRCPW